jgi:hypothetical protein
MHMPLVPIPHSSGAFATDEEGNSGHASSQELAGEPPSQSVRGRESERRCKWKGRWGACRTMFLPSIMGRREDTTRYGGEKNRGREKDEGPT